MRVGFTVVVRPRQVEFRIACPASSGSSLVSFFRSETLCAVLMGRLYYRADVLAELRRRVEVEPVGKALESDAALAAAVYRHLGLAGLERLEGDFALVVWDASTSRLVALRDPMGGYPLFWTARHEVIAFSTSTQPLLAWQPRTALDREYLAEFIMMPAPRHEGATERSVYEGISRVLPGSMAVADGRSPRVERHTYWDWREHIDDPGTADLTEVADGYLAVLTGAVRERLRGRVLAHLSGGMDSTSVALLARQLVGSAQEGPVHTLSLMYSRLPTLARETPYVKSALAHQDQLVSHQLAADDLLDFDSFVAPPLHDEPYGNLWRFAMDRATVHFAADIGASTMLTGLGADEIHDVQPYYLTDLLRRGHLLRGWQEAVRWARVRNCSPWAVLHPFGLDVLKSAWAPGLWGNLKTHPGGDSLREQDDSTVPPWIAPEFARRYALAERAVDNARQTYRLCPDTGLSVTVATLRNRPGDVLRWSVAAPLGIAVAHPFLDTRVLSLGLGIQARFRPEPGKMKPVLAAAMGERLPAKITQRRSKSHFNEVYYLGLGRNVHRLEAMMRQAPMDGLAMVDKASLIQAIHEASLASAGVRQLQRLNFTLSLIKWLSMEPVWRGVPAAPTDVIHVGRSME